jgi:hypothetical protein
MKVQNYPIEIPTTGSKLFGSNANNDTVNYDVNQLLALGDLSSRLFAQISNSTPIANTIVEGSLVSTGVGSLSVPANGFQVGDSFHAKLIGRISCNSAAEIRIKIKSGLVVLADTGIVALDASTGRNWEINVYFTVRELGAAGTASIASGGIFSYIKNSGVNFEGINFSVVNDTTFDTTGVNTLDVTAQWQSANVADSIYSQIFTLSKIY